ncbi:Metallo-dependent hydrolase [Suillus decipiens]|nr:Metallo-dependent hydrolase [Suillus decipiens]
MEFDLVVRNGTVVTASDIWESCDIGIKDGTIVAIGPRLPAAPGAEEIDAEGAFITPGGVDAHVHLSQFYEGTVGVDIDHSIVTNGVVPDPENFVGDTFTTGTRSAVAGGTTTVITFASQMKKDESIIAVIEDYHKLAKDQSFCDYAFHVIITNPTPQIVEDEFPRMVDEHGITSVKLYMTYKPLRLLDYQILDVMYSARKLGITTMVHAENADVIDWMTQHLEQKLMTHPYHHGTSRPPIVEAEATNRVICLAELMDTPILLVHISGGPAATHIRDAQTRLLPIYGETCPQYMFLLADSMRNGDFEGKVVFSHGEVVGEMEYGQYIQRQKSLLPGPRDVWLNEWRP